MRSAMTRILTLAALLPFAALAQPDFFQPEGEIRSAHSSAAFDGDSVRGPGIQVTREPDGRWVGWLGNRVIDVAEVESGIRGANVALYLSRGNDGLIVRGYLGGRTVTLYIPDDGKQRDHLRWKLLGLAGVKNPPIPQFIFAAIAALT